MSAVAAAKSAAKGPALCELLSEVETILHSVVADARQPGSAHACSSTNLASARRSLLEKTGLIRCILQQHAELESMQKQEEEAQASGARKNDDGKRLALVRYLKRRQVRVLI